MGTIREENVLCIIPDNPSSQLSGFTVYHISDTSPISLSITPVPSIPPPFLVPYALHLPQQLPSYLDALSRSIHVIISIKSGSGQALQIWDQVIKPILHTIGLSGESYHILETESDETVRKFALDVLRVKAAEGRPQTVLLLSGDGGVVDLLNGVMSGDRSSQFHHSKFLSPTVILFPLGTANALFHSTYRALTPLTTTETSPSPLQDTILAIHALLFGSESPLPTFRATFSSGSHLLTSSGQTSSPIPHQTLYGSIVASYGLHSSLVADSDTPSWRQKGPSRFALVAQQLLNPPNGDKPHVYHARVTIHSPSGPELLSTTKHGYILLTLVSNLEKTFTISPASRALDGQLRVVQFGDESAAEVERILGGAYRNGAHVGDPKVRYEPVRAARIEFLEGLEGMDGGLDKRSDSREKEDEEQGMEGRWRRVCIDGLIVRVEKGGWMDIETLPKAEWPLNMVTGRVIHSDGVAKSDK